MRFECLFNGKCLNCLLFVNLKNLKKIFLRSSSVLCWPERVTKVDCNEEWTWDLSAQSNLKKIGSITKLFSHQFGIVVYINSIFLHQFFELAVINLIEKVLFLTFMWLILTLYNLRIYFEASTVKKTSSWNFFNTIWTVFCAENKSYTLHISVTLHCNKYKKNEQNFCCLTN